MTMTEQDKRQAMAELVRRLEKKARIDGDVLILDFERDILIELLPRLAPDAHTIRGLAAQLDALSRLDVATRDLIGQMRAELDAQNVELEQLRERFAEESL